MLIVGYCSGIRSAAGVTKPSRVQPTQFKLRSSSAQTRYRLVMSLIRDPSLPLRFLAMNAIRMRWEMLRACIF